MTGHQKNSDDGGTASVGEGNEKGAPLGAPSENDSFFPRALTVTVSGRAPTRRRVYVTGSPQRLPASPATTRPAAP